MDLLPSTSLKLLTILSQLANFYATIQCSVVLFIR